MNAHARDHALLLGMILALLLGPVLGHWLPALSLACVLCALALFWRAWYGGPTTNREDTS